MEFSATAIEGVYIVSMKLLQDERGFFSRTFCKQEFEEHGLKADIVQTNISYNKIKGTLRGMHMQTAPYAEAKIVRCSKGHIFDVVIDMRKDSSTYLKWVGFDLKADEYKMIYIPENFAHGFITLEDNSEVTYMHTQFYAAGYEKAFRWNDTAFDINWPLQPTVMAEKDKIHPLLQPLTTEA